MNKYDLLTDNQKAFVKTVRDSVGIPEIESIEFLLTESASELLDGHYCADSIKANHANNT